VLAGGGPVNSPVRQLLLKSGTVNLKTHLASSVLVLFVLSVCAAQTTAKRDLTRYDQGGTFDFTWSTGPAAHERMRPLLREFVWRHWSQKQLGRVVATYYTIEGDPTTYNFFIEPDANGRWLVIAEYDSECCWNYALEKPKRKREHTTGVTIYDIVDRVVQTNNRSGWLSVTSADFRDSKSYSVRLRRTGADKSEDPFIL
jgi:hypothetical protein